MSESPTTATNPRILIVGNAGQLGRELEKIFAGFGPIVAVDRESVDLADAAQTRELVRRAAPDIILNAAAYTAVDRAETERDLAYAINEQAPRVLAEEALLRNALFVHYSTDYVFDGSKSSPWVETDAPNPLNVYGASKLAGERAVEGVGGKFLIFRTSWVYGPHGNNFLLTMLRLARERDRLSIVDDQIGGPTTSIELARATHLIVTGILAGQFRRAAGLGWPLPHDLRRLRLLVRLCPGHLRPRRPTPRRETTRSHPHRHQGLSHPRRAPPQFRALQRQIARPLRRRAFAVGIGPRRNPPGPPQRQLSDSDGSRTDH